MLLREALSSENTPLTKLLRIANNTGSSEARPASPQLNEVDPHNYQPHRKLNPGERAELAALYEAGATMIELAAKFECHRQTVARQLKKVGVTLRVQQVRSPEFDARAETLYAGGQSLENVAGLLDVQASTIARALRSQGVTLRPAVADRWHLSPHD